jgi:hypothetical protein
MKLRLSVSQRVRCTALGILAGAVASALWRASGAGEVTAPQSSAPLPAAGTAVPAFPQLPVVERPLAGQPPVGLPGDSHLDKTPPRRTKGLDLVRMGWTYNCMECHKLFPAKWHYDRPMAEHQDVKLEHGNNRFCLNCHHATNRNAFVDYDGSEIAQAEVVQLCAKCHGPIYNDWRAGVHGRSNGYWDAGQGAKTKLRCIQCHDPHQPKFKSMKPLAPLTYPRRAAYPPKAGAEQAKHP